MSSGGERVYVVPGEHDVLCGRGRAFFEHPGNASFRRLIEETLPNYAKAKTKGEKTFFVRHVVGAISKQQGRFLKLDKSNKNQWYEGDAVCAKSKVGHALRDSLAELNGKAVDDSDALLLDESSNFRDHSEHGLTSSAESDGISSLLLLGKVTGDTAGTHKIPAVAAPSVTNPPLAVPASSQHCIAPSRSVDECFRGPVPTRSSKKPVKKRPIICNLSDSPSDSSVGPSVPSADESHLIIPLQAPTMPSSRSPSLPLATSPTPQQIMLSQQVAAFPMHPDQLKQAMLQTLILRQQALEDQKGTNDAATELGRAKIDALLQKGRARRRSSTAAEIIEQAMIVQQSHVVRTISETSDTNRTAGIQDAALSLTTALPSELVSSTSPGGSTKSSSCSAVISYSSSGDRTPPTSAELGGEAPYAIASQVHSSKGGVLFVSKRPRSPSPSLSTTSTTTNSASIETRNNGGGLSEPSKKSKSLADAAREHERQRIPSRYYFL